MKLPVAESLTVEFKSDREQLSDRELAQAVVCLANTDGGMVYLGIEDDRRVTGLNAARRSTAAGLAAQIANLLGTQLSLEVAFEAVEGKTIAVITVPKATTLVSTSGGVFSRRRLKADGSPECVPMQASDVSSRLANLHIVDPSAQAVASATLDDLDPTERERLRGMALRAGGDRSLADLDDEQLDGALSLTVIRDGARVPTLTGMLMVGREDAIRRLVPSHEIAFQVLDDEDVRTNEFRRLPLLRAFEWIDTIFTPLNPEREFQFGLFRVGVPLVDRRSFREAFANAVTHRDYARLGAVHVKLERDALVVTNPGGFVDGVTIENLLTTPPTPRNPTLADALKRVGLVERTGRGVDLIYRGLLRFGRPLPDYSASSATSVQLRLPSIAPDPRFVQLVVDEEERSQRPLPVESLIALSMLREQRRVTRAQVASAIQANESRAGSTLEHLVERGLVEAHGRARGRSYTLASKVYTALGDQIAYTRQVGLDDPRNEALVCKYVADFGVIKRAQVMELCRLDENQATRLLASLVRGGRLIPRGEKRGRDYLPGPAL